MAKRSVPFQIRTSMVACPYHKPFTSCPPLPIKPFAKPPARPGKNGDPFFQRLKDGTLWTHKELVTYLKEEHGLSDWWQQMVTVEYEKRPAAGERKKWKGKATRWARARPCPCLWKSFGTFCSAKRVCLCGWEKAWKLPPCQGPKQPTIPHESITGEWRMMNPHSHMRFTWQKPEWDKPSTLQVRVTRKGLEKTTLTFYHEGLTGEEEREERERGGRGFWGRWQGV